MYNIAITRLSHINSVWSFVNETYTGLHCGVYINTFSPQTRRLSRRSHSLYVSDFRYHEQECDIASLQILSHRSVQYPPDEQDSCRSWLTFISTSKYQRECIQTSLQICVLLHHAPLRGQSTSLYCHQPGICPHGKHRQAIRWGTSLSTKTNWRAMAIERMVWKTPALPLDTTAHYVACTRVVRDGLPSLRSVKYACEPKPLLQTHRCSFARTCRDCPRGLQWSGHSSVHMCRRQCAAKMHPLSIRRCWLWQSCRYPSRTPRWGPGSC